MAITVNTAAQSNDITTLSQVKLHLGIDTDDLNTYLGEVIKMVSAQIEAYLNYPLGQRTITETLPSDASHHLRLSFWPIVSVEHVKYDGTTVATTDYTLQEPEKGLIYNDEGWIYTGQEFTYEVKYVHGYVLPSFTSGTRDLPYDLEMAAIAAIKEAYYSRNVNPNIKSEAVQGVYSVSYANGGGGSVAGGGGVGGLPAETTQTLNRYRRYNI